MTKEEKLYFTSIDDTFCQELKHYSKEDLEELNYNLIEAEPDDGKSGFIWCSYKGECVEKYECKKSECPYYKSKSGRGKCQNKGSLYWHGKKINVRSEFERL